MEYRNRTVEDVLSSEYVEDPAWNVFNALSWIDIYERESFPFAIHYSGLHLRFAVEHLWFELFGAAIGGKFSQSEYRKALKTTTTLYKLIDIFEPYYEKFAIFMRILAEVNSAPLPQLIEWDILRLRRIHGECSMKTLHFQGLVSKGYLDHFWMEDRLRFLSDSANWMRQKMSSGGFVVYKPEKLKDDVLPIWERFRDGDNDEEDVRNGLKIIQPIVADKPLPKPTNRGNH